MGANVVGEQNRQGYGHESMDYGTGFPNVVVAAVACHVQTKTCEDSQQPKGIEPTINLEYTFHGDNVSRNFLFLFPHGFNAVAYLLESLLKVLVGAFAWVVDNRDGLLRHGCLNLFHALDEADNYLPLGGSTPRD